MFLIEFNKLFQRIIPKRLKKLARFGVAGLGATVLYFILVTIFVAVFKMSTMWASICAYLLCIVYSYFVQSRYTFQVKSDSRQQVLRFVMLSVSGFFIAQFGMYFITGKLNLNYIFGAVFVCGIIPLSNFVLMTIWVFADEGRQ